MAKKTKAVKKGTTEKEVPLVKLDLGCGNGERKAQGFIGVDIADRPGVDVVCDLSRDKWPWADNSVDEVICAHMLEHVEAKATEYKLVNGKLVKINLLPRCHFFNELYRVLKPGAKALIITPHWASNRAYGDVTHVFPPISEMFWYSLDPVWRKNNQPHLEHEFKCNFQCTWGYSLAPWMHNRNPEFVNMALSMYKEAAQDMNCTIVKLVDKPESKK